MSDVFILGAGFSKAISDEMPLMAELGQRVLSRVMNTRGRPAALSMESILALEKNIELILSFLGERQPWQTAEEASIAQAAFLALQTAVGEVIGESQDEVLAADLPDWLRELCELWFDRGDTLITLNYDTLLEEGLRSTQVGESLRQLYNAPLTPLAPHGGSSDSTFNSNLRLLKLHGSINWFHSGAAHRNEEPIYAVRLHYFRNDHFWQDGQDYWVAGRVPLIVPPLAHKEGFYANSSLRAVWSAAASALREAEHVYCIGYSMPMTDLTVRALLAANTPKRRRKLVLVNKCPEAQKEALVGRFRTVLPEHLYELVDHFVRPTDVLEELKEGLISGSIETIVGPVRAAKSEDE